MTRVVDSLATAQKRARLSPRPPFVGASLLDQKSIPPPKSGLPDFGTIEFGRMDFL
jgi:hypothetical protein